MVHKDLIRLIGYFKLLLLFFFRVEISFLLAEELWKTRHDPVWERGIFMCSKNFNLEIILCLKPTWLPGRRHLSLRKLTPTTSTNQNASYISLFYFSLFIQINVFKFLLSFASPLFLLFFS